MNNPSSSYASRAGVHVIQEKESYISLPINRTTVRIKTTPPDHYPHHPLPGLAPPSPSTGRPTFAVWPSSVSEPNPPCKAHNTYPRPHAAHWYNSLVQDVTLRYRVRTKREQPMGFRALVPFERHCFKKYPYPLSTVALTVKWARIHELG